MPDPNKKDEISFQWFCLQVAEHSHGLLVLGGMILSAIFLAACLFVLISGVLGPLMFTPILFLVILPTVLSAAAFVLTSLAGGLMLHDFLTENNNAEPRGEQKQVSNDNFFTKACDWLFPPKQLEDTIYEI